MTNSCLQDMCGDLGNRRSIRLSYGGTGGFPSVSRGSGQRGMRERREGSRFVSAQKVAQSVRLAFWGLGVSGRGYRA